MYIPGRLRTASSPSRTWIALASYLPSSTAEPLLVSSATYGFLFTWSGPADDTGMAAARGVSAARTTSRQSTRQGPQITGAAQDVGDLRRNSASRGSRTPRQPGFWGGRETLY